MISLLVIVFGLLLALLIALKLHARDLKQIHEGCSEQMVRLDVDKVHGDHSELAVIAEQYRAAHTKSKWIQGRGWWVLTFVGSLAIYADMVGLFYGSLLMVMLFVHECGHAAAMRVQGMRVKAINFLPLLGAVTVPDGQFPTRTAQMWVAIMGPIAGAVFSGGVGLFYLVTGRNMFLIAAYWLLLINLFNCLPVSPFDGGHIVESITSRLSKKRALVLLVLFAMGSIAFLVWIKLWFFVSIAAITLFELLTGRGKHDEDIVSMNGVQAIIALIGYGVVVGVMLGSARVLSLIPGVSEGMHRVSGI